MESYQRDKGMSGDTKYKVKDKLGESFLLRVAEINAYQIKNMSTI